ALPIVAPRARLPAVVFGAFDRHNLGDMLLAHVAEALLAGRQIAFAGLADRDLRPLGGHRVHALPSLAARWRHGPALLWHAGGELLGCRAWQAALMLMDAAEAPAAAVYWQRRAAARAAWAQRVLGTGARTPYAVARERFPAAVRIVHAGVGGVALARAPQSVQAELRTTLASADAVAVRDARTLAWMRAQRIAANLVPDPAVLVAELFGRRIARHAARGEPARLRAAFPRGWIALQCSAVFGDDATLDALAAAIAPAAHANALGVALLRAGAAPWHDDAAVLRRLAARLGTRGVQVIESLHLWDLCAVVAGARAVVASSLHLRLVACAFARARITLAAPGRGDAARKHRAVIAAWDADELPGGAMPGVVALAALAPALAGLLARDAPDRRGADGQRAAALAARCRHELEALRDGAPG
ncbi:MAG TPA: polysaccharide pyruvyl transferase family protein, partial [Rubrivivax sp.]|nr:polysaccharide pyruvyl transferase family protein [Rubrivivax sp.]